LEPHNQLFVVRVDAARIIGTGHVVRCLSLASALRESGATVVFICRPHDGHLCTYIEAEGFTVIQLPTPRITPEYPEGRGYESWFGATIQNDAHETRAAVETLGRRAKWMIVDHYGASDAWERAVRPCAEHILAIDDLTRDHSCDVVLDQNVLDPSATKNGAPIALLGPTYALLSGEYASLQQRIPPRSGAARRVFVFLGDAGPLNITGKVLRAIIAAGLTEIHVDVVISRASPHLTELQSLARDQKNLTLHHGLPTLAPLMAKADLAIGAGGSNSWERLCLGLPTAIITVADNQKSIAESLHRHKLALWIGHYDEYTDAQFADRLRNFLTQEIDSAWSSRCREAVDGNGARRVSTLMMLEKNTDVTARHATLADGSFVKEMLGGVFDTTDFSEALRDIERQLILVAETASGIALGYMRFVLKDGSWDLAYAVHPICGAEPLRAKLLAAGVLALRQSRTEDVQFRSVAVHQTEENRPTPHKSWRINICSDRASWINPAVSDLVLQWLGEGHYVNWSHDARRLPAADFGFYLSYGRIVDRATLDKHLHNLVVHESDLPKGRGWSPLSWQILEGCNRITATLFEAADSVDSGVIYQQEIMTFDGRELVDELRAKQARATLNLCLQFVARFPDSAGEGRQQQGEPTFYPKRTPVDSRLDPTKTLAEQINQLRVADNARYPAFMDIGGQRYYLRIEKA